jgi:hypothetical protein
MFAVMYGLFRWFQNPIPGQALARLTAPLQNDQLLAGSVIPPLQHTTPMRRQALVNG